jgi:hypothetical protein
MIFDDYLMADQGFEMQKCAADVPLKDCSLSEIDFINPLRVNPSVLKTNFVNEVRARKKTVTLYGESHAGNKRITKIVFDVDGSFEKLSLQGNGRTETFLECGFPLLR